MGWSQCLGCRAARLPGWVGVVGSGRYLDEFEGSIIPPRFFLLFLPSFLFLRFESEVVVVVVVVVVIMYMTPYDREHNTIIYIFTFKLSIYYLHT